MNVPRPSRPARSPRLHRLTAALLAASCVAGCRSQPKQIGEGAVYPNAVKRGRTLDIQVFRRETEIEFTNTTARAFPACTLWLNGRFSYRLEHGLAVGQNERLPLRSFKDQFGDPFRGGGFFATEKPERLALAEIQIGEEMLALVVVGGIEQ
jgi:hypothetical protein